MSVADGNAVAVVSRSSAAQPANKPGGSTQVVGVIKRLRRFVLQRLFRWLLLLHRCWTKLLEGRQFFSGQRGSAPHRILLTGTFFSENWIMNHLRPIELSDACRQVTVISIFPVPESAKVTWKTPGAWLSRILGETPARLLLFVWEALRTRPTVLGGFHLIPNALLVGMIAPLIRARSLYFCGGGPREVLAGGILGNRLLEGATAADPVSEQRLIRAIDAIDHTICMGGRTAEFFQKRGVRTKFAVIPGGIDNVRFTPGQQAKSYDLILVGRLVQVKRIDLLLDAVGILVRTNPELRCAIVGSGELDGELKSQAVDLGIAQNVDFVGQQSDIVPWLQKSKIFVLTSDSEGLSLAMMEALSCGLPCVVSDVGELGEVIVSGTNGCLVSERTGLAFARHLDKLLSSPGELARMSEQALETSRMFSLCEAAQKWDQLLAAH